MLLPVCDYSMLSIRITIDETYLATTSVTGLLWGGGGAAVSPELPRRLELSANVLWSIDHDVTDTDTLSPCVQK